MEIHDLISEAIRERNNLSINLEDLFLEEVKSNKRKLTSRVVDCVQEELKIIDEYRIEEMVEEEYIRSIHGLMCEQIDHISRKLDDATATIIRLSESKSIADIESLFTMLTNELVRNQNWVLFEELNEAFKKEMYSSILRNRELEMVVGENRLYDAASNIRYSMRSVLDRYMGELTENIEGILREQLSHYHNKVMMRINEYNIIRSETEKAESHLEKAGLKDIEAIQLIATFAGINFKETSEGIKASVGRKESTSFIYKQDKNTLVSENSEIKMSYIGEKTTIINKNRTFSFDGKSFAMGTIDNPEQIKIEKVDKKYQISYSGEIILDPIKRGLIFQSIKQKYPIFYERMLKSTKFAEMHAESELKEKESTEILIDETGIVKLNPTCREAYIEKMQLLGFKIVESAEGVSLVNSAGNIFPITRVDYNYVSDDKKSYIYSDLYITTNDKIKGPMIRYSTPDFSFFCTTNYRNMNLMVGENHYFIGIKEDGTVESSITKNGKKYINDSLVLEAFQRYIPNALLKISEIQDKIIEEKKAKDSQERGQDIEGMLEELDDKKNLVPPLEQSIDSEIIALMQNPKVQRYMALIQRQMAIKASNQTGAMRM